MEEEKHHHGLFHHHHHHKEEEEKAAEAVIYSETTYSGDGYGGLTESTTTVITSEEPEKNYAKEVREHKHKEHMGELGALAAGAFCDAPLEFSRETHPEPPERSRIIRKYPYYSRGA